MANGPLVQHVQLPYAKGLRVPFTTFLSGAIAKSITWAKHTVQISKDAGTFTATSSSPSEVGGQGFHTLQLSASETTCEYGCIRLLDGGLGEFDEMHIVFQTVECSVGGYRFGRQTSDLRLLEGSTPGTHTAGYFPADLRRTSGVALGAAASGYLPADSRRVDGVALATHGSGHFPGDTRRVDGSALLSHTSGCFPSDVLRIDSAVTSSFRALVADSVWDEAASGHLTAGTFGAYLSSLFTDGLSAQLASIDTNILVIDGIVDEILQDTGQQIPLLLANIAVTGGAVNEPADSYTLTAGTQTSGTFASTSALDSTYHVHQDDTGALDLYYEFDIGGDGIPTSASFVGYLTGNNDVVKLYAYNWVTAAWDQVGLIDGTASANNQTINMDLVTAHVGTGADIGTVRVRFFDDTSTLSSAELGVDQILVSYTIANRSVGYANGAVWIDTNNGTAGTETFVNGTADKPVDSLADAVTIASALNIRNIEVAPNSALTLATTFDGWSFRGEAWTLALGGQVIQNCYIQGADEITGVASGSGVNIWDSCDFGVCTVPPGTFRKSGFTAGPFTFASAGDYLFNDCRSDVPGVSSPEFGYNGLAVNVNFRNWSGGQNHSGCTNASAVTSVDLDPGTCTVNSSCTAGLFNVRGVGVANDNSTGTCSVVVSSLVKADQLDQLFFGRKVAINTVTGSAGTAFPKGTPGNPVDNVADARTIADAVGDAGVTAYEIIGSITLAAAHEDWLFSGIGGSNSAVNVGGQNVAGSQFLSMNVQGTFVSETDIVEVRNGPIGNVAGFRGSVVECGLFGTWAFGTATNNHRFVRCQQGNSEPTFDCTNVGGGALRFMLYDGAITFDNLASGDTLILDSSGGAEVTFGAGCTGGTVVLRGVVEWSDLSGNITPAVSGVLPLSSELSAVESKIDTIDGIVDAIVVDTGTDIPARFDTLDAGQASIASGIATVDAVADAILEDTGTDLPAGQSSILSAISGLSIPTVSQIADGVLDEPMSGHLTAGTAGKTLADALDTFANSADVVIEGGGTRLVSIYEDDDVTVKYQVRISTDGLSRTRL